MGQNYTDPTPNSLQLHLEAAFLNVAGYSPDLDSWNGSLYLKGRSQPFTTITIPHFPIADNGTMFTINQRLVLSNEDETLAYTKALITQESVSVAVVGRGGLKQNVLPHIEVNYNLTSTFKGKPHFPHPSSKPFLTCSPGFNSLKGISVSNLRLASQNSSLPYSANAAGNVTVPNPSNLTVVMGDLYLNMSVAGTPIGYTTIPSFVIAPGNVTYPLYANVDQVAVAGVLSKPKYRCGVIDISLAGTKNASTFDGEVIPYTTRALNEAPLQVTLNLTDTLQAAGLGGLITGACEA